MLQLRYNLARDRFQYASVFGDPGSIRNLYWQLTHNYQAQDGQKIGTIKVTDSEGRDVTSQILTNPHGAGMATCTMEC